MKRFFLLFVTVLLLFVIAFPFIKTSTANKTLDSIAKRCDAQWKNTNYVTDCIIDQIQQLQIFQENYMPYIIKYKGDKEKIKSDLRASAVFYCFFEYYDEEFDIVNYGLANVCVEGFFQAIEKLERKQK